LADSWRLNANGDAWIVTLRPNARFSDNTPVKATDVVSSWMMDNGTELRPEASRLVRSISAVDDRTLAAACVVFALTVKLIWDAMR
jgi:ABC-type transport system substrate-binding protein